MKITKTTLKKKVMKTIISKSVKIAGQNVNSACVWWINQLVPLKEFKSLRKF